MPLVLVVGDHCLIRRIRAGILRVAVHPSGKGRHALHSRRDLHEHRLFGQRVRSERAERRDVVDDPDAASVRGDHQVVVPGMNDQVAHRDAGQVASLVLGPLPAAVEGNPQSQLGAQIEKIAVDRILAQHVRVAAHGSVSGNEWRPRFAEIGGAIRVRTHIAERVRVERGVRGPFVEMARIDVRDPGVPGNADDVPHHIAP